MNKNIRYFLFLIFLLPIISIPFFTYRHNVYADQLQNAQADRAQLESQLADLEAQIAQKQKELEGQKGQSASITNDINRLTLQINKAKLDIQASELIIKKLGGEITQKNTEIVTLSQKIVTEQESLAQLIRKSREIDDNTFMEFALSDNTISDVYGELNKFTSINSAIKKSVDVVRGIKTQTEVAKQVLQVKKDKETDTKVSLENEKAQVVKTEQHKQELLSISKNKEAEYQQIIAEQQKKAADIKARLFKLAGGSQAIRFDQALAYAEETSAKTSVDPAFLLAILTQESNLGSNVGKCKLTDLSSGAGVSVSSGKIWSHVMKPTRDVQPFVKITGDLGFSALTSVVSCPISNSGYGGAMGPAQFIPSTWMLFVSRITSITGSSIPNPWDNLDAFTASALYLSDLGATGNSYSSQMRAACKYYGTGGSSCSYGKSVMKLKTSIQSDIDYLKQYGVSKR